jgi:NADP-dependent 3-hydroxy acid dehydrogenase YdfG
MPGTRLVVAITGASAGIGRAIALRFAKDGAVVAICARRKERLDAVAGEIERAGGTALPVVVDVSKHLEVQSFVDVTLSTWGRLDVMVCNAGYGIYGAIDRITPEQMQSLIDVNYLGTFYAARAALPIFRKQQHGHLFIVSSIVGKRGVPYMGAYTATKFAQVGLAECLRAELAGTNIHVSAVIPISTETEFAEVMTRHSGPISRSLGPRQTADQVAEAVARAIDHPVPEVYPFKKARGLVLLNAIAPRFCDRIVRRWGRKPVAE